MPGGEVCHVENGVSCSISNFWGYMLRKATSTACRDHETKCKSYNIFHITFKMQTTQSTRTNIINKIV